MLPAGGEIQSYHVACLCLSGIPHTNVTIRIGQGRVLDVIPGRSAEAVELGSVALVDGLVNAHTHLEFSLQTEPIPTRGRFTDWIRQVVRYRREHPESTAQAIRTGIDESLRSGTTLIGDIATVGWSADNYQVSGCRRIVFQEVLGLSAERMTQQRQLARSAATVASHDFAIGISPHAPYLTHFDLVRYSVQLALEFGCPVAMHLAETKAELELLAHQAGEFRELLIDFGIWNDNLFDIARRPLDYLHVLAEAPRALIVHGNYLQEDELQFIASQPQMTLIYCPRTHAAFAHDPHPWQRLIELGGRVAIGTDSRASNPDLSLFAELQYLAARHPNVSHLKLLELGSRAGRTALGFGLPDSLAIADLTLIQIEHSDGWHIERNLFSSQNRVCGTMIGGAWISGGEGVPVVDQKQLPSHF